MGKKKKKALKEHQRECKRWRKESRWSVKPVRTDPADYKGLPTNKAADNAGCDIPKALRTSPHGFINELMLGSPGEGKTSTFTDYGKEQLKKAKRERKERKKLQKARSRVAWHHFADILARQQYFADTSEKLWFEDEIRFAPPAVEVGHAIIASLALDSERKRFNEECDKAIAMICKEAGIDMPDDITK